MSLAICINLKVLSLPDMQEDTFLSFEINVYLILFVQRDTSWGRNGLDSRDFSCMSFGLGLQTCVEQECVYLFIIANCYYSHISKFLSLAYASL
jgi:hypothetical protein